MSQTSAYIEINVIDNYAPAVKATVTDTNNNPVKDARVCFKIYNYAEFYTVASKQTDNNGKTTLSAGRGDMLIWATNGELFGYGKLSFAQDTAITILLDKQEGGVFFSALDIIPPVENSKPINVSSRQRTENNCRMLQEDSIRNAYTATFMTLERAAGIARELGLPPEPLATLLIASRGNHGELTAFLRKTPAIQRLQALELLQVISAKDLRDTPENILTDHLQNSTATKDPLYNSYILNPRVTNEMLTAYKNFFRKTIAPDLAEKFRADPAEWTRWCMENITLKEELNPQSIPMMPQGVWKSRIADRHSKDIFYVAVLRSLGIAARIDEVTGKPNMQHKTGNGRMSALLLPKTKISLRENL